MLFFFVCELLTCSINKLAGFLPFTILMFVSACSASPFLLFIVLLHWNFNGNNSIFGEMAVIKRILTVCVCASFFWGIAD